jgi:hypothetical protein
MEDSAEGSVLRDTMPAFGVLTDPGLRVRLISEARVLTGSAPMDPGKAADLRDRIAAAQKVLIR